jgi:ASCH domain
VGVKALSVQQPWADAIVRFGKDIENRTWATPYRGLIAIHAGLRMRSWEDFEHLASMIECPSDFFQGVEFETGGVVGVARLVGCVRASASRWFDGPVGLVLAGPLPTIFVPCRGQLGIFDLPGDVTARITIKGALP